MCYNKNTINRHIKEREPPFFVCYANKEIGFIAFKIYGTLEVNKLGFSQMQMPERRPKVDLKHTGIFLKCGRFLWLLFELQPILLLYSLSFILF